MLEIKRFNVLEGYNYSVLNDPEYGEDSVREDIITPIIKALGYSPSSQNKMIRSRKLLHPYVSIGSQRKKIDIIPDYVMEICGRPCWIMEAKAPNQDLLKTKHIEQAYSYAIHSEIKALYYTLCNGKEFLLYHVSDYKPILHFDIRLLPAYWGDLVKLLSPSNLYENSKRVLDKDFGLHLKRLGFEIFDKLIFIHIPIPSLTKLGEDLYTFGSSFNDGEDTYCVSFDFKHEVFLQLKGKIPDKAFDLLAKPSKGKIIDVQFADTYYYITVECVVGTELQENDQEIFLPLILNKIR